MKKLLALLAALLPAVCSADIALVSGQTITGNINDPATSGTLAMPGNVTSGNLLVCVHAKLLSKAGGDDSVAGDLTKSAGTATIGTVTLDRSASFAYSAGDAYVSIGIFSVPITGSGSLTVALATDAAAGQYTFGTCEEFSGADVSGTRVAQANSANNVLSTPTTAVASGNVTLSSGGMIYCGFSTVNTSVVITPDAAFTAVYENESNSNHMGGVMRRISASGLTDSCDWTLASNHDWVAAGVAYKAAAAGGTAVPVFMHHYNSMKH